jgi:hypothetical protein
MGAQPAFLSPAGIYGRLQSMAAYKGFLKLL